MYVTRFLNSINKDIVNKDKNIINLIIAIYSYKERAYKTNKENISIPRIKNLKVLKLLKRL